MPIDDTLCNRIIVDNRLMGAVTELHILHDGNDQVVEIHRISMTDPPRSEVIRKTNDHILVVVGDLARKVMGLVEDAMSEDT